MWSGACCGQVFEVLCLRVDGWRDFFLVWCCFGFWCFDYYIWYPGRGLTECFEWMARNILDDTKDFRSDYENTALYVAWPAWEEQGKEEQSHWWLLKLLLRVCTHISITDFPVCMWLLCFRNSLVTKVEYPQAWESDMTGCQWDASRRLWSSSRWVSKVSIVCMIWSSVLLWSCCPRTRMSYRP